MTVREEYQTLATITLQNYFRLYEKLSGMTGTAMTEASEFDKIYKLGVVPIPTNQPMARIDQPDLVYRTEEAKFAAVVDDIAERHAQGPADPGRHHLGGEVRAALRRCCKKRGVPHSVLNAKQHADEAKVVALAGHKGAVTVATNMAGRGTDIMLGGSTEFLADQELRKQGLDPVENAEEYNAAWPAMLERITEQVQAEHDEVRDAGGLYVLGTERHESRRIDNQLRGRSGRQGDPGESRFYLSLGDDLMRLFKSDRVEWVLLTLKVPDDVPIENKRVTNVDRVGAGPGRGAQLRVPQERPEVRRRDEPAARGHLRRAPRGPRGGRPAGPGAADDRRGRRDLRRRRDRGLPGGVGPRGALDRAARRSTRSRCATRTSSARPAAATGSTATRCSPTCRPTRRRRTRPARPRSGPR